MPADKNRRPGTLEAESDASLSIVWESAAAEARTPLYVCS